MDPSHQSCLLVFHRAAPLSFLLPRFADFQHYVTKVLHSVPPPLTELSPQLPHLSASVRTKHTVPRDSRAVLLQTKSEAEKAMPKSSHPGVTRQDSPLVQCSPSPFCPEAVSSEMRGRSLSIHGYFSIGQLAAVGTCQKKINKSPNSQLPTPLFCQVFEAALAWIRYDRDQRESFLPELLSKIRLPLCRPQFLTDRVQQDDLVRCCHKCR